MRLLPTLLLSAVSALILNAQTTMCFKEAHPSMKTINDTVLDGGLCAGTKTPKQMQKEGWIIDDIKVTTKDSKHDYIYIFKKESPAKARSVDEAALEARIIARLDSKKKEEAIAAKIERKYAMSRSGKSRYTKKCQSCHGEKGELQARGVSRPLKDLSLVDFKIAIRDYMLGEYDRGMAFVMTPYAKILTDSDIKNIYVYLQYINQDENKDMKKQEAKK